MALTGRARRYLAQLERCPTVPTADVERILRARGYPCLEPWLAFHDEFAGYVEQYYRDPLVYGLVVPGEHGAGTGGLDVAQDRHGATIACAHGAAGGTYRLDMSGTFLGRPRAASFTVKIERDAHWWADGWTSSRPEQVEDADREELLDRMAGHALAEASDDYFTLYADARWWVLDDVVAERLSFVWRRV